MFHNLFDSHTHSDNSPDAVHSVMYMAEHAEGLGLMGLAITDHAEVGTWREEHYQTRVKQSIVETAKARAAYLHRMILSFGVELGFTRDFALADRIVNLFPFDFVLGSVHYTRGGIGYYRVDYRKMDERRRERMLADYLDDVLCLVRLGNIDSLAHLTFPLRCAKTVAGIELDLRAHTDRVDEVLRTLIGRGIALELNVCGLYTELGDIMPPLWVIRRYRELGGEIVTVGSDAHRAEDIGRGIEAGMQMLLDAGFEYFAFYSKRKPVMLRLV